MRLPIFLLLLSLPAWGKDTFIARISENYSNKSYDLLLELNDRGLISGIKTRNNKKKKIRTYGLDKLTKSITLAKTAGISLATLKCTNFNTARGCDIAIRYPSNLTFGRFTTFHTKLRKENGVWGLYSEGRRFKEMRLIARKALGLPIGVKRIELH